MDSYPTEDDIIFEIHQFLEEKIKLEEEWTLSGVKSAFSKKLPDEIVQIFIDSLVIKGIIEKRESPAKKVYYKIAS